MYMAQMKLCPVWFGLFCLLALVPGAAQGQALGQACQSDAACQGADALCLSDALGYPWGQCTAPCDGLCAQEGATGSLCVAMGGARAELSRGQCAPLCDAQAPQGQRCRAGYACRLMPRAGEPGFLRAACVPDWGDWSGQTGCQRELDALGVVYRPVVYAPRRARGVTDQQCQLKDPVYVWGHLGGVRWRRASGSVEPMLVSCPMALALHRAAVIFQEEGVEEVIHLGTTHCRPIAGSQRLSQHSFGMAIDIAGFVSARKGEVSLSRHWEHDQPEPHSSRARLLWNLSRRLHREQVFNIILTPAYNQAHHDHFHLDLTPGRHFLSRGPDALLLGD